MAYLRFYYIIYIYKLFQNSITENEEIFDAEGDEITKRSWFMSGGEQRPKHHDPHAKLFPEDAQGDDR